MSMQHYFEDMDKQVHEAHDIAEKARNLGYDPEPHVAIPLAKNMAERVVGLISVVAPQMKGSGVDKRISELEQEYGVQDWRVALKIALEVAEQKFCTFEDKKQAMEVGIRTGIAYVTNGVVASPLEGFTRLEIRKRKDGGEYVALFFSGPIRSAGGTGASVSVLIGNYVSKNLGYQEYDPTEVELKRMVTELYDYHDRVTNLQYLPSEEEIHFMVEHLPVQIEGDPSEKFDVSNYKGLERMFTDKIRNGPCLVLGEGICQKAPKLHKKMSKWKKDFGLEHWSFLGDFVDLQKKIKSKQSSGKSGEKKDEAKLKPDYTFIKDIVAGRPVLTYPLAKGGFRLRYGRCRTSGFSTDAIHPATMVALNKYIAIGTQLKVERPGKSTVTASCDIIEGPIVKLNNGNVVFLETVEQAQQVVKDIEEIIYLGDILINYGDFLDRAHMLIPPGYCEEWWALELEKALKEKSTTVDKTLFEQFIKDPYHTKPTAKVAITLSKELDIPLHPRYTYHWSEITKPRLINLLNTFQKGSITDDKIVLPITTEDLEPEGVKRTLELLGVPHQYVSHEYLVVESDWAHALKFNLENVSTDKDTPLEMVNDTIVVRDKSGTTIGARMGRPEKAKMRKLTGSPQVLFPVGEEGGRLRCFQAALEKGKINAEFPLHHCEACNKETIYKICETCNKPTKQKYYCYECGITDKNDCHERVLPYKKQEIDIKHYFDSALKIIGTRHYPELIKGVRGTSNQDHTPEHLVKGILRAQHKVYANKDGTTRYDMTEMPITHFKPKEIGVSVKKLQELGYTEDIHHKDLVNEEQIIEIKPQDVILPDCDESLEDGAKIVLHNVAQFVDELLLKLYNKPAYYQLKNKDDLVGHLIVALSPHTSAGIVGRIIGFSKTQGFLTHPSFHSIMRRDCDGDEACVMLLMDMFLNFSRNFLPTHRGATQDAPLVLTSKLIPKEVDDMVFNMDVAWSYPLELYEAAMEYKFPWDVKIDIMENHLGTPREYVGFGFTHDTSDLNFGAVCSSYKSLPTMAEKVVGQMELAENIRAVDQHAVAALVIERHFIRDIRGNLRKFSMQQFRCVGCNEKFRRPPLMGVCTKCKGKIIFTISEGSIVKYLEPSLNLVEKYAVTPYLEQNLEITKMRIESMFGKDPEKQEGLGKWFG